MTYIIVKDEAVRDYSLIQLRKDNPNVSFSEMPTPETLAAFDVYWCEPVGPQPEYNEATQRIELDTVQVRGAWRKVWRVVELTDDEKQDILDVWREATYVTQSQIRITLMYLDLLDDVVVMANADPSAAIVWEYATDIRRNSPFISALRGEFTETQIDDIFRYAQALVI